LMLVGSGHKGGNTDKLADAFAAGAAEAGHEVSKIHLGSLKIEDCRGCGACQRNGNHCAIRDDMEPLYQEFADCDMFVLASPLYFWTISGRLKCFIDRLYAISRNDEYPAKKTALLMTAGDDKTWTFDAAVQYYHTLSQIFGGQDMGMCLAGGCVGCEEGERQISASYLEMAKGLGKSI